MKGMNEIQFTRNMQNTRSFGNFLKGMNEMRFTRNMQNTRSFGKFFGFWLEDVVVLRSPPP